MSGAVGAGRAEGRPRRNALLARLLVLIIAFLAGGTILYVTLTGH